jgi:SAM-dependent methyltransferase
LSLPVPCRSSPQCALSFVRAHAPVHPRLAQAEAALDAPHEQGNDFWSSRRLGAVLLLPNQKNHGMNAAPFPATSMPDADWWQTLWPDPAATLARLGIAPEGKAIDLCCGDGLFTVPLARHQRLMVALDLDLAILRLARRRAEAADRHNISCVAGDACDLACIREGCIDFVLMANTFHGVPDQTRLAQAVVRVLAPGGRFAVINWHRRPREETTVLGKPRGPSVELRMAPADLEASLLPAGLRPIRLVELPPYHYAAVFTAGLTSRG